MMMMMIIIIIIIIIIDMVICYLIQKFLCRLFGKKDYGPNDPTQRS
jgi:uncharacterized protein HemY